MMSARVLLSASILAACVAPASAQTFAPRGYVTYGSTVFSSSDTFEAITGESSKTAVGVGGALNGIWRGLFVDVGVTPLELEGQRVFVEGREVFPLGIPVTIKMRPVDLAGGWRMRFGRVSPYAGAGVSFIKYEEHADFAQAGDDIDESKSGAMILAGVDVAIVRWLHAGGEFRYRAVKGVLGDGGVSDLYGEDQLGGYAFALRVSVGR